MNASIDAGIQSLVDHSNQSPEWLAMSAYAILVYITIKNSLNFKTFASVSGYTLLFFSKYYKVKNDPRWRYLQAYGYAAVLAGLSFKHWRDAFAVAGYALAIAEVDEANVILASVLAASAHDANSWAVLVARGALIAYLLY